jgi:hypothetical protein
VTRLCFGKSINPLIHPRISHPTPTELAAALKRALGNAPGQDGNDNDEEEDQEATRRRIKTEGPGPVELPDMAAILGGKVGNV